jgi:hypothetical protein
LFSSAWLAEQRCAAANIEYRSRKKAEQSRMSKVSRQGMCPDILVERLNKVTNRVPPADQTGTSDKVLLASGTLSSVDVNTHCHQLTV